MPTPAVRFLQAAGIAFDLVRYEHLKKGAVFASRAAGFPLSATIKTLVFFLDGTRYGLVLAAGDRRVDMRRLAQAFQAKRAEMAPAKIAERLTGYRVGGISPFGTRQKLAVVMDRSVLEPAEVLLNAGQRGVMLKMSPADIRRALDCRVAPVCSAPGDYPARPGTGACTLPGDQTFL